MSKSKREEHLEMRFKCARAFVSGELDFRSAGDEVAQRLNISTKTLHRPVSEMFSDYKPSFIAAAACPLLWRKCRPDWPT